MELSTLRLCVHIALILLATEGAAAALGWAWFVASVWTLRGEYQWRN